MKQKTFLWLVIVGALFVGGIIGAAIQYSNNQPATNQPTKNQQVANQNQTNNMDQATELKTEDVKVGTGPAAKAGDSVTVNYTGTFADGTVFDSSLNAGRTPFVFTLGNGSVIQGWDQGVVGMQVGGTRKLTIPPALGYGAQDYGPIPGNSTSYFTVELLKIGA